MLLDHLQSKLRAIEAQSLTRFLREAESPTAPHQTVRGADGIARELLMFCSNDYLGLAAHPRIAEALAEGARLYGGGSGASPLVSGHSVAHKRVTDTLADWFSPHIPHARALGFCTGYMANLAVVTALGDVEAEIFSESLNHASLIDGTRLARARTTRYGHADVAGLRDLLAASTAKVKLIVTDAVFSMDGDIAPLPALLALAEEFDAWLIVDDAHGFGVLGERGEGTLSYHGMAGVNGVAPAWQGRLDRLIYMATLGKAAGVAGAFIAGEPSMVEWVMQKARTYMFATAAPAIVAESLRAALRVMQDEPQRRAHLRALQARLQAGVNAAGLPWRLLPSDTAIQPLIIGSNEDALAVMARLDEQGVWVPAIRPPTVPEGTARLRISLSAAHTVEQVDQLCRALAQAVA